MIKDTSKTNRYYVLIIWICIIFLGCLLYVWSTNTILYEEDVQISQIGEATAKTIVQWRKDRIGDARSLSQSISFSSLTQEILDNPQSITARNKIKDFLKFLSKNHNYQDAFLVSNSGNVLVSYPRRGTLYQNTKKLISQCYEVGKVVESDFYYCPTHKIVHYDVIVPIRDEQSNIISIVILRVDPTEYFYENLNSYGSHFSSSEVLLGKQIENKVHILNPLKSIKNDNLALKIDGSQTESPIIQAVHGAEGIVEGVNYNGDDVFAYITKIPRSDWVLSVQVDKSEIKKDLIFRIGITFGVTALIMGSIFLLGAFRTTRKSNKLLKHLFEDEKTIRLQNEKYKSVILGISEAVIITDHQGRITSMNSVAEKLTGWSELAAMGKQIEVVCPVQEVGTTSTSPHPLRRLLNENVTESQEKIYSLFHLNRNTTPVSISPVLIKDQSQVSGAALIIRDKTQEFETIRNTYLNERRLQQGEVLARTGYWEIDAVGMIYEFSEGTKNILGLKRNSVPYSDLLAIIHPEDLQRVVERHMKMGKEITSDTYEFRIIHPESKNIVHLLTTAEMVPNANKVFGVIQDITESKIIAEEQHLNLLVNEALVKLNTSKVTFSEIFDLTMELGAKIVPYQTAYFFDYKAAEGYFELKAFYNESGKELDAEVFRKSDSEITAFLQEIVDSPEPFIKNNESGLHVSIKPLYCPEECKNLLAIPLKKDDSPTSVVIFIGKEEFNKTQHSHLARLLRGAHFIFDKLVKDSQLRIYAERLRESNDTKDKFVSILAHDLRNPFHAMLGVVDTLQAGIHTMASNDVDKYLKILSQSVNNQYTLLNELLEWSRLHSDQFSLNIEPMNVHNEISSVVNSLQLNIAQKSIELTTKVDKDLSIEADANMFRLVIRNLLSNAIKFTATHGSIIINGRRNNSYANIELIDSGVGMSQSDIEKLLNASVRFTTNGTNREKGTGLGIQFVREIIEKHKGHFIIESTEGSGSKFIVEFPLKQLEINSSVS